MLNALTLRVEVWLMVSDILPSPASAPEAPKLLDQVRARIRLKHYSLRTETAYIGWIRRFIFFIIDGIRGKWASARVEAFLSALAVERNVSASTQSQALSALLFLYREVLEIELPWLDDVTRAKKPSRLPTVLTREEPRSLIAVTGSGLATVTGSGLGAAWQCCVVERV